MNPVACEQVIHRDAITTIRQLHVLAAKYKIETPVVAWRYNKNAHLLNDWRNDMDLYACAVESSFVMFLRPATSPDEAASLTWESKYAIMTNNK